MSAATTTAGSSVSMGLPPPAPSGSLFYPFPAYHQYAAAQHYNSPFHNNASAAAVCEVTIWDSILQSYLFVSLLFAIAFGVFLYALNPPLVHESSTSSAPDMRKILIASAIFFGVCLIGPLVVSLFPRAPGITSVFG